MGALCKRDFWHLSRLKTAPTGFTGLADEELFEILTWAQLGFHQKPVGLLDMAGYYEPLLALCDRAVEEGFLSADSRALLLARSEAETLLAALAAYRPEPVKAWIQEEKQL